MPLSTGRQDTDSISSDLRAEAQWEVLILLSIKTKKEQFSLEQLTKESYLFVTGLLVQLMRQVAKMTQSLAFGVKRDALDLLLPWICFLLTKVSSLLFTTSISAFGKLALM
jgi:hypothetical protein